MENVIPQRLDLLGDHLARIDGFWEHWGFEPWSKGPFVGVARLQRFTKDGFLGPIAQYQAWDCIVWQPGTEKDRNTLWDTLSPLEDVMTQRFLFILEDPWPNRRIKSFVLGFKGYLEFHAYWPAFVGGASAKEIRDLADLVDMGLRLALTGRSVMDREIVPDSNFF